MDIDQQINAAVQLFKTRRYQDALNIYNTAISDMTRLSPQEITEIRHKLGYKKKSQFHPKLGAVLDQRAATYEKLGKIQRALQDGEKTIACEPNSCKGYLRVGKLQCMMGRKKDALATYRKGVSTIEKAIAGGLSVPERLLESLRERRDELEKSERTEKGRQSKESSETTQKRKSQREILTNGPSTSRFPATTLQAQLEKMVPLKRAGSVVSKNKKQRAQSFDPLDFLPPELIGRIFSTFKLKFILTCHSVSRKWRQTLLSLASLYPRICFRPGITPFDFTCGLKLAKRVAAHTFSQQTKAFKVQGVSNAACLKKVLEGLIAEPNLGMRALELYDRHLNMQALMNRFSKYGWKTNNMHDLHSLKLGINSSIRYQRVLLSLFKQLRALHIVVLLPEMSSASKELVPQDKMFRRMLEADVTTYPSLETLVLVNHPKLLSSEASVSPGIDTYDPYPVFLSCTFANLVEVTLVSFSFRNILPRLGDFFLNSPRLESVYFENNDHFTLVEMLQLLKNYNPSFRLRKLTFRDKVAGPSTGLRDFSVSDLPQLENLTSLDINGNSLAPSGLIRLLKICNRQKSLCSVAIGASSSLRFRTDGFASTTNVLSLYELLSVVPSLKSLDLHELALDNRTMQLFHADIVRFGLDKCRLRVLDVSFCQVDGIGLINLFNVTKGVSFTLDRLVVDGVEINEGTLALLRRTCVGEVLCDEKKRKWGEFGLNTLIRR